MSKRRFSRDRQWDEKDDTSKAPILPKFSGESLAFNFPPDFPPEERERLTAYIHETRRKINEVTDEMPDIRIEGGKMIIPVVMEKMILVKRLVVTDEIILELKYPYVSGHEGEQE